MIGNAKKLIQDIKKKVGGWDERSQFTLEGVRNLSLSDLDTLELYADKYISSGGQGFPGLMRPMGATREVLEKYGIL